jgi:hypothetical protein
MFNFCGEAVAAPQPGNQKTIGGKNEHARIQRGSFSLQAEWALLHNLKLGKCNKLGP